MAGYLTTQSNVIARLEDGAETVDAVTEWLKQAGAPFFAQGAGLFRFWCGLDLYRRASG